MKGALLFCSFALFAADTFAALAPPDNADLSPWRLVVQGRPGLAEVREARLLAQPVYTLQEDLLRATIESGLAAGNGRIELPLPDGRRVEFLLAESQLLSPELARRYPAIRTFALVSVDGPRMIGQADLTPLGFSALLLGPEGSVQIAPAPDLPRPYYYSFYERDMPGFEPPVCHAEAVDTRTPGSKDPLANRLAAAGIERSDLEIASGDTLRTYELAVATTAEYYSGRGNNDADVLASIVTVMNKVDLILRSEVAISLTLIGNTDDLFFTDPDTYTGDGDACTTKDENQAVVDGVLASNEYDIGFLLDARANTGGGCASGAVVCDDANKARGSAGLDTTQVAGHEGFGGYRLVLHEMGHQFGAGHTWSGQTGNCTADQYSASNAYEPGGGTTLMSYSGTCGPIGADSIQGSTGDTYYHGRSFDQIVTFATGGGDACAAQSATANQAPTVDAGPDYTIPRQTPFTLSGSGNDPDGDPLTFTWEQFDLAAGRFALGVDDGVGPIIRSRIPTPDPTRTIPPWDDILNNTSSPGELLPQVDRSLNFRLTARDNFTGGGGVDSDAMQITVDGAPFFITSPNGGEAISGGCDATVTWSVGGGDVAASVDLLLSDDGGASFQSLLLGTPNDGSQSVPEFSCTPTSNGRVMAAAVDNIFFDVSDADFLVLEVPPAINGLSATGGAVDDNCEFTVTFEAEVTDDCSVAAGDVTVDVQLVGDNAVLGVPVVNVQQVDAATVSVDGSVLVSGLTDSPAQVGIAIEAVDGCGFDSDDVTIAQVVDNTPPTIDVSLDPDTLWPPNHKMRTITATVDAEDNCDPDPEIVLLSVESSEPEDDLGDGAFLPDIQGVDAVTPDFEFRLRAERQGLGADRIYTATYGTADDSGNLAQDTAMVVVPQSLDP